MDPQKEGEAQTAREPPWLDGHNPLAGGQGEDPFLPYPSTAYLRSDRSTKTGFRLSLPPGMLPKTRLDQTLDVQSYNQRDGYSPATRLLVYFPKEVDGKNLPGPNNPEASLARESPIVLLRYDDLSRVPFFAELDQNARPADADRQGLLIQPVDRLAPGTRYLVAISGLVGKDGAPVPPLSGFGALRDNKLTEGSKRRSLLPLYEDIFATLNRAGIPRASLQLAWDFVTGNDDMVSGRLVRMRDGAFRYTGAMGQKPPPPVTVTQVREMPYDNVARQIVGTFSVPSYLLEDTAGRLLLSTQDGEPRIRDFGQFPLVIHIPACALGVEGTLPVMIYGHGLFGEAKGEMESSYQREIINRLCMVQVGTDWIGLADEDALYVAKNVISNFNNFVHITDRLQQAHVNVTYLARLIKEGGLDGIAGVKLGGRVILDGKRLYYYGISDGGIQGATTLALTPEIERGCLNVPGGFWSMMMYRSANFQQYAQLIAGAYPDALDRQLLVVLTQQHWDYTDPATYAPHLLRDPLPGVTVKKILYQEGVGDGQVPNVATRAIARVMGLPLLAPPVTKVHGIQEKTGPLDFAYVQFDIGQNPLPGDTNVPPKDNAVHEAVRRLEAAKEQLKRFLTQNGKVEDTCGGKPCSFPRN